MYEYHWKSKKSQVSSIGLLFMIFINNLIITLFEYVLICISIYYT